MIPSLPVLVQGSPDFDAAVERLRTRGADDLEAVAPTVREILARVRREGDAGVLACIAAFEKRTPTALVQHEYDGAGALARLDPAVRAALELAADRIRRYHERQRLAGFEYEEEGVTLGMRVRPLARVGVYAPGGKARYPSSVLMTAIPAQVAGVRDIVLATPNPNDSLLAAAHLAGVRSILDAGGAHAIAALAYGTASLPRVDKIVGPGNAYVACAKRLVYGDVDIDSIAGPSEILALADATADPALVAADLVSQAEHDEAAYAILLTTSAALAKAVNDLIPVLLATLTRGGIIQAALASNGMALVVPDRATLLELASTIGAEHVAIHLADPVAAADAITVAGALLVGASTPVAAGDYLAGPSHVLPTGGGARFGSPLGVYDFVARTSLIRYSPAAIAQHGPAIIALARAEGLDAHAQAVEIRLAAGAAVNESAPRTESKA